VLSRLLSRGDGVLEEHGIRRWNVQPEVIGIPDGIAGVFDRDHVGRIVLAIAESGDTQNTVAIGASEIAAEGHGEQL
jgi:hypothetical protein